LKDRVIRGNKIIHHHISSSIWSSIKEEFSVIAANSIWLLGNGQNINFWNDNWCGTTLADFFNLPAHISQHLTSTVSDYIVNGAWSFPPQLLQQFNFSSIIHRVIIPYDGPNDQLLWIHTDSGDLQLKDAYCFKFQQFQELPWAKLIWSSDIPPSKSLLVWRLMHDKVPTDEQLIRRGCYMPSMCSLCFKQAESTFHLFFDCSFAIALWSWLANCLNISLQFTSMEDMWKIPELQWSPQAKITIIAAIINLLNSIWNMRNQARFDNKKANVSAAISSIIANTSLSGNHTLKAASNSLRDFRVLKHFKVDIHAPKIPFVKEIIRNPPLPSWVKCNVDGASKGNPGQASCGGIFRNNFSDFLLCFAEPLGFDSSYHAELQGALRAIEVAHQMNWNKLWLETDSNLVVLAFTKPDIHVPWFLRNRWHNALILTRQMDFLVSHICREGNQVADVLANYGSSLSSIMFWQDLPLFIKNSFDKNKFGFANFRVVFV
jgi:ribonuclease HI